MADKVDGLDACAVPAVDPQRVSAARPRLPPPEEAPAPVRPVPAPR